MITFKKILRKKKKKIEFLIFNFFFFFIFPIKIFLKLFSNKCSNTLVNQTHK